MERELRKQEANKERYKAERLLDGLIIYHHELGELGKQLERLLRLHGVRASVDPACSTRYH